MKIAWLSSWPPRPCGIATYSLELVQALRSRGNEVHVVCHPDGGAPGEKHVHPIMDTTRPGWDEAVFDEVGKIEPEVVHIQHEYGLYQTSGDGASGLFRLLYRWKAGGRFPVVATYHSVYSRLDEMKSTYIDVMQKLIDAGILHELYQWIHLPVNLGRMVENVYVIPHGAGAEVSVSREEARRQHRLEGKKVIGMIGWFTHTKGFHRVLERWDSMASKLAKDTVLVLAGEARMGDPAQQEYKEKLLSLVERSRYRDRIRVIIGSFPQEEYERVLGCFDLMVMPYTFASQSGNLAHSFSLGVPVVITAMEGLKAEIEESGAGLGIPPEDDEELERAIVTLMGDDALRARYSERGRRYVKDRIGWPLIVEKHLRLYRKLISRKRFPAQDRWSEVALED